MSGSVIVSPLTDSGKVDVSEKGILYYHGNTQATTLSLTANKNYYVDEMLIIPNGVTITVPDTTLVKIS